MELCKLAAASQRPPKDGSGNQALPLVSRPPGSHRGMGGLQPPISMPILCSRILHLPSLVRQKVRATPARTTPWGLCCVTMAAGAVRGGGGTQHQCSDGKHLGFSVTVIQEHGPKSAELGLQSHLGTPDRETPPQATTCPAGSDPAL